ncbi:MAG: LIC_12708 family protein [Spirochaetia bacterium]
MKTLKPRHNHIPKRTTQTIITACILFSAVFLIFFTGCTPQNTRSIAREELFTITYGRMAGDLDLFQLEGIPAVNSSNIYMRDGIFYISNSNSDKVMMFNSYGDLLSLYYNTQTNPEPVLLSIQNREQEAVTNRRAFPYSFYKIGSIAVNSDKYLLVEDQMQRNRWVYDEETNARLNRIVLRFDNDGRFIDYLGQEGIGGTPFPYIEDIYVNSQDQMIVISRTAETWMVFWFSENADLLYEYELSIDEIPVNEGENAVLETLVPDQELPRIYCKVDYFTQSVDTSTQARSGIVFQRTNVYWIDLDTGDMHSPIELPVNRRQAQEPGIVSSSRNVYVYQLIGTVENENLFFASRDENNRYSIMIMDTTGTVIARRHIHIEDSELVYKSFHVSQEGILSALLCSDTESRVVWWRTDRIFQEAEQ